MVSYNGETDTAGMYALIYLSRTIQGSVSASNVLSMKSISKNILP